MIRFRGIEKICGSAAYFVEIIDKVDDFNYLCSVRTKLGVELYKEVISQFILNV